MAAIIPAVALGAAIGQELPKFFDDAFDQFGAGEGVYLRDGEPASLPVKVGQAIGRAYCRAYDDVASEYPPGKGERIEKACRPYLDSIGSPNGPRLELPFEGGQCDEIYLFEVVGEVPQGVNGFGECVGRQPLNVVAGVYGPILGFSSGPGDCGGGPEGDTFTLLVTCFGASGGFKSPTPVTIPAAQPAYSASPVNIRRQDGQPDNCGNPPPVVVTPDPTPNPNPPPFRFNPSPDVNIDIDVQVGPNGDITFDIGTGPITVDPFGDGDGDGGGGEPGDGGGDGEPGAPGDGQETGGGVGGEGGETEGEAEPGFVLTGLRVFINDFPQSARRFSEDVFRGVAYVYMGTEAEGLALEPSGANLRSGQFVYAQKDYLTSWAVRATPGYNLLVIPYYREVPA